MPLSAVEFDKLKQFFKLLTVALSAAGLAALNAAELDPDGLLLLFEACSFDQKLLIDRLLTVPLSLADSSAVAVSLIRHRAASSGGPSEGGESSSQLVNAVAEALAEGDGAEAPTSRHYQVAESTVSTGVERAGLEGESTLVFMLCMFGVLKYKLAANDHKALSKLRQKVVSSGIGEWHRHLADKDKFESFFNKVIDYLAEQKMFGAVQRLRAWLRQLPKSWPVAKQYITLYFEKYEGAFPVEVDSALLVQAQDVSLKHIEDQLKKVQDVSVLISKLEKLESTASAASKDDGWRKWIGAYCWKCGASDHIADKCPLSKPQAKKVRAANVAKRKAEAAANKAAAGAATSSSSDSD
jgi:hypothetical protein